MKRRQFLPTLVLCLSGLLSFPALAASKAPVNVVKVIGFDCEFSRNSESIDILIKQQLASDAVFSYAVLPTAIEMGREIVYYTIRNIYPFLDDEVRKTIFKGAQEDSAPLDNPDIALTWLSEQPELAKFNLAELRPKLQNESAKESLRRAITLIKNSGTTKLPTYILIKDNQIEGVYDISSVPNSSYSLLRDLVISKIKELSN